MLAANWPKAASRPAWASSRPRRSRSASGAAALLDLAEKLPVGVAERVRALGHPRLQVLAPGGGLCEPGPHPPPPAHQHGEPGPGKTRRQQGDHPALRPLALNRGGDRGQGVEAPFGAGDRGVEHQRRPSGLGAAADPDEIIRAEIGVEWQGQERRFAEFERLADAPALRLVDGAQSLEAPGRVARHQHDTAGIGNEHALAARAPCRLDRVELDLHDDDAGRAGQPASEIVARPAADRAERELRAGAGRHRFPEIGAKAVVPAEEALFRGRVARGDRHAIGAHHVDHRGPGRLSDLSEATVHTLDEFGVGRGCHDASDLGVRGERERQRTLRLHLGPKRRDLESKRRGGRTPQIGQRPPFRHPPAEPARQQQSREPRQHHERPPVIFRGKRSGDDHRGQSSAKFRNDPEPCVRITAPGIPAPCTCEREISFISVL
ncbi:UNVERIFIED_ORG: hypothetical protein M2442_003468 [Methylorubrum zatmanii]|nr:hypothetical protein [Methylorubrum zatmanii]